MRNTTRVALTLAVATSACEAPDSQLETRQQPIVAGTPDTGDPAIMELLSNKGNLWARCTATLITPRILLTAAHCFAETPGFTRGVFPGNVDTNFTPKDLLPVEATAYDPAYGAPRQGHDFAIIVLASPLPIRPIPFNRASLDKAQGKTIRYVGYGLVTGGNPNAGGVKRQATAPIAQISNLLIVVAPNAHGSCEGDSGGPMLLDDGQGESIVGIASFVDNGNCTRNSFYQRVDTQLAWLDGQLAKYGTAGPPPDAAADTRPPSAADAGAPDSPPPPPDARTPEADAAGAVYDTAPPLVPDAAAPPPATNPMSKHSAGCAYGGGTRPQVAVTLLVAAWLMRRRARQRGGQRPGLCCLR
jgi:V8-like Glu-specific endopeptidase